MTGRRAAGHSPQNAQAIAQAVSQRSPRVKICQWSGFTPSMGTKRMCVQAESGRSLAK